MLLMFCLLASNKRNMKDNKYWLSNIACGEAVRGGARLLGGGSEQANWFASAQTHGEHSGPCFFVTLAVSHMGLV